MHLKPGGKLYFEINEQQAAPMVQLLQDLGYSGLQVMPDLFGKDRFIRAGRPAD
jgi:release factor glutamine methyltransferase